MLHELRTNMNALSQHNRVVIKVYFLMCVCMVLFVSFSTSKPSNTQKQTNEYFCDTCSKGHYLLLKQYNSIIDSTANQLDTSLHLKDGLYYIDSVQSNHFNYYCTKTEPVGNTIVKGYYRNGIPVGVWVKYNDSTDWSFNEYFFFEDGVCMKHVFLFHHMWNYYMDSVTPRKDTLIRTHFNSSFNHYDQREYYYIPQDGQFGIWGLTVPDLSQANAYPLDIYNRCFIRREN